MELPGLFSPVVLWVAGVLAVLGAVGTLILLALAWQQLRQARRDARRS